jgi:hypothetical protein
MITISRKFNIINLVSLLIVFVMLCPAYSWAQAENIKTPGEGLEIPEEISETNFLYSGPILSAPVSTLPGEVHILVIRVDLRFLHQRGTGS